MIPNYPSDIIYGVIIINHLDGLTMVETFLRIVSLFLLAHRMPTKLNADSTMFWATFGSVGRALLPT